ncbi:MAG TPA: hypothetical protein DD490_07435 [Acidobacteria bacterium]|nr:hypothetical protein [Acidobacteriota bacterium]
MCGINGLARLHPEAPPLDREELLRTREAMAARGPDAAGAWLSADGRVALASRRLAILDLSAAGTQPMASPDGRWHLVMNGEIYNFRALRRELEADGVPFRSQSDTEVVLALLARKGPAALSRLRGMFGLALWDDAEKRLLLARDPLGIKPLYWTAEGGILRFASQVKALEAGGAVSRAVDPAGLAGFLLWGAVPEPWTIRRAVHALPAGCFLVAADGRAGDPVPYHRLDQAPAGPPLDPLDPISAVEDAVVAHLESDVPVAVFLSAGLDSGLIAALARRHLPTPPTTFTLTFDALAGTAEDEGPLAAALGRLIALLPDPRTLFRGRLHTAKRVAWTRAIPVEEVKTIGKALGGTINDVLLTAVSGAMGRYLEKRGAPRRRGLNFRAAMPVNLRAIDKMADMGNEFGLVFLALPAGIAEPRERLQVVRKRAFALRKSAEPLVVYWLLTLMGLGPLWLHRLIVAIFGAKATAVMTNMPGPKQPLFLAGRPIQDVFFWVPQTGAVGLGFAICSYNGHIRVGVGTDAGLVPDPETIVDLFHAEIEEMRRLAGG